jgi:hypothetical protein
MSKQTKKGVIDDSALSKDIDFAKEAAKLVEVKKPVKKDDRGNK